MIDIPDHQIATAAADARGIVGIAQALKRYKPEPAHGIGAHLDAYQIAIKAYTKALAETVKYLDDTRLSGRSSKTKEHRLSALWNDAGVAISAFDANLANRCFIKEQGWLDPAVWNDRRFQSYGVSVNDMRVALLKFNRSREAELRPNNIPKWFPLAGVAFAAVTAATLTYLLLGPELPSSKKFILNLWMAFCVASSGAFLGGSAIAKGQFRPPFMKETPLQFSATGGAALFVIVFLIMETANR